MPVPTETVKCEICGTQWIPTGLSPATYCEPCEWGPICPTCMADPALVTVVEDGTDCEDGKSIIKTMHDTAGTPKKIKPHTT